MTPTEKHRETASQVTQAILGMAPCYPEQFEMRDIIAAALANAEREGMKRAAEIALRQGDMHMPALGYVISQTILTEAEERTQ